MTAGAGPIARTSVPRGDLVVGFNRCIGIEPHEVQKVFKITRVYQPFLALHGKLRESECHRPKDQTCNRQKLVGLATHAWCRYPCLNNAVRTAPRTRLSKYRGMGCIHPDALPILKLAPLAIARRHISCFFGAREGRLERSTSGILCRTARACWTKKKQDMRQKNTTTFCVVS